MAEIKRWSGIRNTDSPERLKPGELTLASDIDINNSMRALSRKGYSRIDSTACHSLYSDENITLLVHDDVLKSVDSGSLAIVTLASLSTSSPVSYATWADTVYFCNGVDKGRIKGSTPHYWGITPPLSQPVAEAIGGSMSAGKYLYAITYVRNDGQESGTGLSGVVELPLAGGILFTGIPASTESDVSGIILYISTTNGTALYRVGTMPNGTAYYELTSTPGGTVPLETQFYGPPPIGTTVRYHSGKLYVLKDNMVFFSRPYQPELFDIEHDFFQFEAEVSMFEGVNDGFYLGTLEETWFITNEGEPTLLFDYGVIPGTSISTLASKFETAQEGEARGEQAGLAAVWTSPRGICVGREGGACANMTENRYGLGNAQIGAAMLREDNGYISYVVTLRGEEDEINIYEG